MYMVVEMFRNDFMMKHVKGKIVFVTYSKRIAKLHRDSLAAASLAHDQDSNVEYWIEEV